MHLFNAYRFILVTFFFQIFYSKTIEEAIRKKRVKPHHHGRLGDYSKIESEKIVETFHHIVKKILPPYPGEQEGIDDTIDSINFQSIEDDLRKVNSSHETKTSDAYSRKKRNRRFVDVIGYLKTLDVDRKITTHEINTGDLRLSSTNYLFEVPDSESESIKMNYRLHPDNINNRMSTGKDDQGLKQKRESKSASKKLNSIKNLNRSWNGNVTNRRTNHVTLKVDNVTNDRNEIELLNSSASHSTEIQNLTNIKLPITVMDYVTKANSLDYRDLKPEVFLNAVSSMASNGTILQDSSTVLNSTFSNKESFQDEFLNELGFSMSFEKQFNLNDSSAEGKIPLIALGNFLDEQRESQTELSDNQENTEAIYPRFLEKDHVLNQSKISILSEGFLEKHRPQSSIVSWTVGIGGVVAISLIIAVINLTILKHNSRRSIQIEHISEIIQPNVSLKNNNPPDIVFQLQTEDNHAIFTKDIEALKETVEQAISTISSSFEN